MEINLSTDFITYKLDRRTNKDKVVSVFTVRRFMLHLCKHLLCIFSYFFLLDLKGSEDEPAPNQYSNKAKDKLMSKSPSYTIQQGRRGGAVFWMARGVILCVCKYSTYLSGTLILETLIIWTSHVLK